MSNHKINRLNLVKNLVEFSEPLQNIVAQLATMNWDYDGECITLTRRHVASVLKQYIQGRFSEDDIEFWANQIEGREDIVFEINHEEKIEEILYHLANPLLTQPLSHTQAKIFLADLG